MLQVHNTLNTCTKGLVAVGSNMPSPAGSVVDTVGIALKLLSEIESIHVSAQSRLFQTPAYPAGAGPDFINAVVAIESDLGPTDILAALHALEKHLGRTRMERWESRMIDLDLLAFGDCILPDATIQAQWMNMESNEQLVKTPEQLILPHPRLHQRGFVLVPLLDIAPDWQHPVLDLSVKEMVARLAADDLAGIVAL